jgi:hypothetical protein
MRQAVGLKAPEREDARPKEACRPFFIGQRHFVRGKTKKHANPSEKTSNYTARALTFLSVLFRT